jgi:large subunit ribosomal protein L21
LEKLDYVAHIALYFPVIFWEYNKQLQFRGFTMYAIVKTGGKQYQVATGDRLLVEKLEGNIGDSIELNEVLLVADGDAITVGQPVVEGAKVVATITDQGKHRKIKVFKKKRRKGYRLMQGHRQTYTALTIAEISK